jgi:hypothetical protein
LEREASLKGHNKIAAAEEKFNEKQKERKEFE